MAVRAIPVGYSGLIPGAPLKNAHLAVEFMQKVFDATVVLRMNAPDGTIAHCEVRIRDSLIMLGEAGREPAHPLRSSLYFEDADAVFARALAAGATVKQPLTNMFYGDRTGRVIDPCGNEWVIAQHVEDVSDEEMERRMKALPH